MVNGDLRDQIVRLEAEIEQLAEIAERCRKAVLFSKIAIGVGGIGVLAYFIGPFTFDSTVIIGAIAAIVGGCGRFRLKFECIQANYGSDERGRKPKSQADRYP